MRCRLNDEEKAKAVGEALLGNYTLTRIAQNSGMSTAYLSMLTKKARNAISSTQCKNAEKKASSSDFEYFESRMLKIEKKIGKLFKLFNIIKS